MQGPSTSWYREQHSSNEREGEAVAQPHAAYTAYRPHTPLPPAPHYEGFPTQPYPLYYQQQSKDAYQLPPLDQASQQYHRRADFEPQLDPAHPQSLPRHDQIQSLLPSGPSDGEYQPELYNRHYALPTHFDDSNAVATGSDALSTYAPTLAHNPHSIHSEPHPSYLRPQFSQEWEYVHHPSSQQQPHAQYNQDPLSRGGRQDSALRQPTPPDHFQTGNSITSLDEHMQKQKKMKGTGKPSEGESREQTPGEETAPAAGIEAEDGDDGKKMRKRRRLKGELPRDYDLRKFKCAECERE